MRAATCAQVRGSGGTAHPSLGPFRAAVCNPSRREPRRVISMPLEREARSMNSRKNLISPTRSGLCLVWCVYDAPVVLCVTNCARAKSGRRRQRLRHFHLHEHKFTRESLVRGCSARKQDAHSTDLSLILASALPSSLISNIPDVTSTHPVHVASVSGSLRIMPGHVVLPSTKTNPKSYSLTRGHCRS